MEKTVTVLEELSGLFMDSLKRNNTKIKEDRALQIAEAAQIIYKRKIEDFELALKQLKRDRINMMDLSPTSADSLVLASDFDAGKFVDKDIELGVKIRNLEIQLEIAKERYQLLFTNQNN